MDEMQAIEIVIGSGVLGLVITMLKLAFSRISRMEDKVVLRENCKERHGHVEGSVHKNTDNIDKLWVRLDSMNDILIRVDERIGALAKKNGVS